MDEDEDESVRNAPVPGDLLYYSRASRPPMASVAQVATGNPHQPAVDAAARSAQESAVIRDQVEKGSEFVNGLLQAGDVDKAQAYITQEKASLKRLQELSTLVEQRDADVTGDPAASQAAKEKVTTARKSVKADSTIAQTKLKDTSQKLADTKDRIGCGGSVRWCLFGGTLLASYSLTGSGGDRDGQTGHRIVSVALPAAGGRWARWQHLSVDLTLYTAIISPQFQVNSVNDASMSCSMNGSAFKRIFPAKATPFFALSGSPARRHDRNRQQRPRRLDGRPHGWLGADHPGPECVPFWGLMIGTGAVYEPLTSGATQ